MGIKDLNPLLRKYAPQAFGEIFLDKLEGQRIAIDTYNWIHSTYSKAKKEVVYNTNVDKEDIDEDRVFKVWMGILFDFVKKWANHSITPIFVFDGEYPMEKSDTRIKRRESQRKTKERMLELKDKVRNTDPLFVTSDMIDNLRKKIINTRSITPSTIDNLKELLEEVGIPCVQAKYEGEQLCSMMVIDGIASAVFSTDTDNLAYGSPLLITGFSGYEWKDGSLKWKVKCVWHSNIIKQLEFNHDTFVDLCIMCGCDYNTNMRKIGTITSHKLIKEYKSIDSLPSKYDIKCLKHKRCREMFKSVSHKTLFSEGYIDYKKERIHILREKLEQLELYDQNYYLLNLIERSIPPSHHSIPDPPPIPIIRKRRNITLIITPI